MPTSYTHSLRNAFFDPASVFQYVILANEKLGVALLADVHAPGYNSSLQLFAS